MTFIFHHLGLRGTCTSRRANHFHGHVHARPDLTFEGRTFLEANAAFRAVVERYRGIAPEDATACQSNPE